MKISIPATFTVLAATTASTWAAFTPGQALINPNLAGTTQTDTFTALTASSNPSFPGFPGSGAWPTPIESNIGGDAKLSKVANGTGGGPYPAGESIYFGGFSAAVNNNGGTLAVTDATPVSGLTNVVFQVSIGEAWTYDLFNGTLPVLNYNGGAQNLVPTFSEFVNREYNGTVTMPSGEEAIYINTRLVQWDLSDVVDPITSFSVSFTGVQHAQLYDLRLDQSNTFTAVPEPASLGLLAAGALTAMRRRRR